MEYIRNILSNAAAKSTKALIQLANLATFWDEKTGETTALTNSHDISDFKISPDQERIAFTRGINNNPTTLMAFEPVPSLKVCEERYL